jgi:hypothetical protein
VRPRTLLLFVFAALLGAAILVPPALAAPSEVKLEIAEHCYFAEWPCWNVKGNNPEDIRQIQPFTIAQGGTISFADNEARYPTDVIWKGTAPSCTSGVPEAPPTKTGWSGTCTFAAAGDYEFESQELFNDGTFNYTKYEVVVEGTSKTPPVKEPTKEPEEEPTKESPSKEPAKEPAKESPANKEPSPTSTPTGGNPTAATSSSPSSGQPEAEPVSGPLFGSLGLASIQHGGAVNGSLDVSSAGSGGRLQIELLAKGAAAAVGKLVRSSLPTGKLTFTVPLNAKGRAALRRHRRLALTVKITLTPPHGAAVTVTRVVVLRA